MSQHSAVLWVFHGRIPKPRLQLVTCDCLLPEGRNYWFWVQLFFLISNNSDSGAGQMVRGWGAILTRIISMKLSQHRDSQGVVCQMEMWISWRRGDCKYAAALEEVGCLERPCIFHPLEIFRSWLEKSLNPNLKLTLLWAGVGTKWSPGAPSNLIYSINLFFFFCVCVKFPTLWKQSLWSVVKCHHKATDKKYQQILLHNVSQINKRCWNGKRKIAEVFVSRQFEGGEKVTEGNRHLELSHQAHSLIFSVSHPL